MIDAHDDIRYMRMALAEARAAAAAGEIPVGAVIVTDRGRVIAAAHNMTQTLNDVTAHAEMLAITQAAHTLGGKYLKDCTLYVTVEPCPMCAGALGWSQISRIVVGCDDPKRGYHTIMSASPFHPKTILTTGICQEDCKQLMVDFFKKLR